MSKQIPIIGQNKIPNVQMRAELIPSWRAVQSMKRGTLNKVIGLLRGGLGDEVCTEPSLRFAFKYFKKHRPDFELSVITKYPDMWRHLPLTKVYDGRSDDLKIFKPDYHWVTNYPPAGTLEWEFYCVPFCNTVDLTSISMWKCMLHVEDKDIHLTPEPTFEKLSKSESEKIDELISKKKLVLIHAGATWLSRTFKSSWWNEVIKECVSADIVPVLIGANVRDGVGTVPLNESVPCIDLRDKTSLDDLTWLCQKATVVITNDSAPLHLAASRNPNEPSSGLAHIGYIATIRHPSHITHYRHNPETGKNEWNWRETNLGDESKGLWNDFDYYLTAPEKAVRLDEFGAGARVHEILPAPKVVADWIGSKLYT